jgi:hypothetical protein
MRMHIRAGAAMAAAFVLAAAGSAAASATSASSGRWRFSYISHLQVGAFDDVAAVSPHDAWAVGTAISEGRPGAAKPIVEQWRGKSWSAVGLPAGERHAYLTAVAGSSPGNVWVFGYVSEKNGPAPFALHWTGRWALRGTWKTEAGLTNSAVVLNSHDVWAFGPGPVRHYNGSGWTTVGLRFSLAVASAISANDIWAIGQQAGQPILAHFRNDKWSAKQVPVKTSGFALLSSVVALSDRDIWVAGSVDNGRAGYAIALQLLKGKWSAHDPAETAQLGSLAPDGSGGVWAAYDAPYDGQAVYHYAGGRWRRVVLPSVKGKSTSVAMLAQVPRSTTVFGVGLLLWGGLPDTEGAILQYAG